MVSFYQTGKGLHRKPEEGLKNTERKFVAGAVRVNKVRKE